MMRKFELCFSFPDDDDKFLIPDLLPNEEPALDWELGQYLAFEYHYAVLPSSILSRFMVRMNRYMFQGGREGVYWFSGLVIGYEGNEALIKSDQEENKIFIWVRGVVPTRRHLFSIIRAQFLDIHETLARPNVTEVVPFPQNRYQVIAYNHLLRLEHRGIRRHYWPEIDEEIDVQGLLNGIEVRQERDPELHYKLAESFNLAELQHLCHRLGMDYEDLGGQGKLDVALKLFDYMARRGLVAKLVEACQALRPNIEW